MPAHSTQMSDIRQGKKTQRGQPSFASEQAAQSARSTHCTNLAKQDDFSETGTRCTTEMISETDNALVSCGMQQIMPEYRIVELHSQPSSVKQQYMYRDMRS
jgi:hypothetical protein